MGSVKRVNAYILVESLLATILGVIICIGAIHYMFMLLKTYATVQQKFKIQHAKLIARHYIRADLQQFAAGASICNAQQAQCDHLVSPSIQQQIRTKHIKPLSALLVIHSASGDIVYYVRKSVLPTQGNLPKYALYRDDIVHNALALVEEIDNLTVEIRNINLTTYEVTANVFFKQSTPLAIKCLLAKHPG